MTFLEKLPDGCPPDDAIKIDYEVGVFRLVKTDPPTDSDFKSYRKLNPIKKYDVPECIACGLSVYADIESIKNLIKLPSLKKKKICRVNLSSGAGFIKATGKDPMHRTWWPFQSFDIISNCQVEP